MREFISKILNEYISAKREVFAGHQMGSFFRNEIPNIIYSTGIVDSKTHLITGSIGQGQWATVPWVCIFDRSITTSATKGVYIVYLLSKDGNTLYLTFNQGCTDIRAAHSKRDTITIMRERAAEIASRIDARGFNADEGIHLGSGLTELAELYQQGTIFYKAYHKDAIPPENELRDDLSKMMAIYADYSKQPKIGTFDSWEIVDKNTAIKHCDKSFFEYNGSGVPKEICWFFGAENLPQGDKIQITLIFNGEQFNGHISNESSDRRRVRIFWGADLGKIFAEKKDIADISATFVKTTDNTYSIKLSDSPEVVSSSHTWLLTWNPNNWNWSDYNDAVTQTQSGNTYFEQWTCANSHVKVGDRIFLAMLGTPNNGIIASGFANSGSYEDEHWDPLKAANGKKAKYIDVNFDWIADYQLQPYIRQDTLIQLFPDQKWNPQGSGIAIREQYIDELEVLWLDVRNGGEKKLTVKESISGIKQYIRSEGFSYEDNLIENFYLSLKSKPFVILAGTSGTGKTRLVKLFASAIDAGYKMISVRPDWSDSSDLFGHVDLNGKFVPGAIIDFVKRAELDLTRPYFLCLDEMNLARVEYYLSDILSIIETRDFHGSAIETDPLISETYYGADADAKRKYGEIKLPENLYIIGTVNMDETTFPFSRKVLDRANTIEFSYVDLMPKMAEAVVATEPQKVSNSFLKTEYLLLKHCADEIEAVGEYCAELQEINQILQKADAHVGYRVRDEIIFYLLNNKTAGLMSENDAMDHEIMQKILPRIQGSSASIKSMLCELFKHCAGDYSGYQTEEDDISAKMFRAAQNSDCKYKKSAEKIAFMVRRYEEDGFTSYWL